jgi:protein TonB
MNTAANKFSPFIATSAVLHASLFVLVAFGPLLFPKRPVDSWGTNSDKGLKVGLTDSLPGIPLPSPPVVNEAAKPTDTKTLHPAEVAPKEPPKAPPKPAEIKIPERGAPTLPKAAPGPSRTSKADTPAPAAPANAVPGDATGQVPLPYGAVAGTGRASFGGDGTFGTRFPGYVTTLIRAIETSWRKPGSIPAGASRRVYVTFTIMKSAAGAPVTNLKVDKESGSAALDGSALIAVKNATLPRLPDEYSGSSVDVRFYFDYTR